MEGKPNHVDRLADLGIVFLTLAHFYPNGLAPQVDTIPDSFYLKNLESFSFECERGEPLSDRGREILDRMNERGIIPDLTHCSPEARRAIYDYYPSGDPVVTTHVGLHEFKPDPMNLTQDEIQEIADRGGAIGLIPFNYWLDGNNPPELPGGTEEVRQVHIRRDGKLGKHYDREIRPAYTAGSVAEG